MYLVISEDFNYTCQVDDETFDNLKDDIKDDGCLYSFKVSKNGSFEMVDDGPVPLFTEDEFRESILSKDDDDDEDVDVDDDVDDDVNDD